ncbi:hypothetical protein E2C01_053760 [Portunus trituberculatus]|uniref:Uncharacterized protein n=1 Tax=Portunus trituberculatus TaxID=210409 RepID=A0A5B7GI17_PORTR|nr:hypothetical protein [Portunus trituberculatus]
MLDPSPPGGHLCPESCSGTCDHTFLSLDTMSSDENFSSPAPFPRLASFSNGRHEYCNTPTSRHPDTPTLLSPILARHATTPSQAKPPPATRCPHHQQHLAGRVGREQESNPQSRISHWFYSPSRVAKCS